MTTGFEYIQSPSRTGDCDPNVNGAGTGSAGDCHRTMSQSPPSVSPASTNVPSPAIAPFIATPHWPDGAVPYGAANSLHRLPPAGRAIALHSDVWYESPATMSLPSTVSPEATASSSVPEM